MNDITRSLLFGITVAIAITLIFGIPGILCALHGHLTLGSFLVGCDVLGCMVLVSRD